MPKVVRYRCQNCGKRFEIEVLTKEETEEAKRQNRPLSPIHCPDCHRTDVRDGWE